LIVEPGNHEASEILARPVRFELTTSSFEGRGTGDFVDETARRDSAVTAIRHVLEEIAEERLVVAKSVVAGLAVALEAALDAYAALDGGVSARRT
jgi:hypothetical protein